jgi:hypothetical protein
MTRPTPHSAELLLILLLAACASGGAATPRTTRNIIGRPEIEATNASHALELIERLRPEFLRPRSGSGAGLTAPVVYINDIRANSRSQLEALPKDLILEVVYIESQDATTRYGTGHGAGAVLVSTRR